MRLNEAGNSFANKTITVADIGTGSGAIAVSFKKEWPEAHVTATDISEGALTIAKHNAKANRRRHHFLEGDMTAPIAQDKWDVVLSNPPYIAHDEAALMSGTVLITNRIMLYLRMKTDSTFIENLQKPSTTYEQAFTHRRRNRLSARTSCA